MLVDVRLSVVVVVMVVLVAVTVVVVAVRVVTVPGDDVGVEVAVVVNFWNVSCAVQTAAIVAAATLFFNIKKYACMCACVCACVHTYVRT